jgi:hypothetical protein
VGIVDFQALDCELAAVKYFGAAISTFFVLLGHNLSPVVFECI